MSLCESPNPLHHVYLLPKLKGVINEQFSIFLMWLPYKFIVFLRGDGEQKSTLIFPL